MHFNSLKKSINGGQGESDVNYVSVISYDPMGLRISLIMNTLIMCFTK